jgi:hypothetical protein
MADTLDRRTPAPELDVGFEVDVADGREGLTGRAGRAAGTTGAATLGAAGFFFGTRCGELATTVGCATTGDGRPTLARPAGLPGSAAVTERGRGSVRAPNDSAGRCDTRAMRRSSSDAEEPREDRVDVTVVEVTALDVGESSV